MFTFYFRFPANSSSTFLVTSSGAMVLRIELPCFVSSALVSRSVGLRLVSTHPLTVACSLNSPGFEYRPGLPRFSWVFSVPSGKFQESTSIRPPPLPFKSFPVHHSTTVLIYGPVADSDNSRHLGSSLQPAVFKQEKGYLPSPPPNLGFN
jgi:hypothetical protein